MLKNLSVYDRTVGALLPIGRALTNAKPRKLDTEKKTQRKTEFRLAGPVSAGQKYIVYCISLSTVN